MVPYTDNGFRVFNRSVTGPTRNEYQELETEGRSYVFPAEVDDAHIEFFESLVEQTGSTVAALVTYKEIIG